MKIDFWKAYAIAALLVLIIFGYYFIQTNKYYYVQDRTTEGQLFFRTNKISGNTDLKAFSYRESKMTNWKRF